MRAEQIKLTKRIIIPKNTYIKDLYCDESPTKSRITVKKGQILMRSLETNSYSLITQIRKNIFNQRPNPYHPLICDIIWELAKQDNKVVQIEI